MNDKIAFGRKYNLANAFAKPMFLFASFLWPELYTLETSTLLHGSCNIPDGLNASCLCYLLVHWTLWLTEDSTLHVSKSQQSQDLQEPRNPRLNTTAEDPAQSKDKVASGRRRSVCPSTEKGPEVGCRNRRPELRNGEGGAAGAGTWGRRRTGR
jgi:hypothetical protein